MVREMYDLIITLDDREETLGSNSLLVQYVSFSKAFWYTMYRLEGAKTASAPTG